MVIYTSHSTSWSNYINAINRMKLDQKYEVSVFDILSLPIPSFLVASKRYPPSFPQNGSFLCFQSNLLMITILTAAKKKITALYDVLYLSVILIIFLQGRHYFLTVKDRRIGYGMSDSPKASL